MLGENKKIEYRSSFNKKISSGNVHYVYYERMLMNFLLGALIGFLACYYLLWYVNLPFLKGFNSLGILTPTQNLGYLFALLINKINLPFFGSFYNKEVYAYSYHLQVLLDKGYLESYSIKILASSIVAVFVGAMASYRHTQNPIPSEVNVHRRGFKVLVGDEARSSFLHDSKFALKSEGEFIDFATDTVYPMYRVVRHTVGVGATGTGKSQFLRPHIEGSIAMGLKTVILDAKYEFTTAYYDPNDSSMAILDYTDRRTYEWEISKDIQTIPEIRRFANSFIPVAEGDNAIWSNSARLQFIAYYYFLLKTKKNFTLRDLADLLTNCNIEESYFIFKNYYPPALDTLGMIKDGKVEENVTSYGIKANLKSYIDGLLDMGRYSLENNKKISLKEFMSNPDYEIKTLFIKPNENEKLMSSGLIRTMLNYMISLLDSPLIPETKEVNGIFFLDEFQAPGELLTEDGKPTIDKLLDRGRSKGWGAYLFCQDMLQLENTYSESIVNQWFVVSLTKVLTGTPPGKTAEWFANMIGKNYYDKLHKNQNYNDGKLSISGMDYQMHNDEVVLPSELSSYLKPTEDGNIRFLMLGAGLSNAYIFENPIVPLPQKVKHWIPAKTNDNIVNRDSGIFEHIEKISGLSSNKEEDKIEEFTEEQRNITIDNIKKTDNLIFEMEKMIIFNNIKNQLSKLLSKEELEEVSDLMNDVQKQASDSILRKLKQLLEDNQRIYPLYKHLLER